MLLLREVLLRRRRSGGRGGVTSCLHANSGRRAALICKHITQREDMEGGGVGNGVGVGGEVSLRRHLKVVHQT